MQTPMEQLCGQTKSGIPPAEFDMATFAGRWSAMCTITSPGSLLTSVSEQETAKSLVMRVHKKETGWQAVIPGEYYRARTLYSAVYHPDTNEALNPMMRFSAFLPSNIFILLGMLHPSQQKHAGVVMFWQWLNQTYNVAVNYANRNASAEVPPEKLFASYCAACGSAMGLSALGNRMLGRIHNPPAALSVIIPYMAVAMAAIANVGMMRSSDYTDGVSLVDAETREPLEGGLSQEAGKAALGQVMVSRVMVPFPLLTFPPLGMLLLNKISAFHRMQFLHLPAHVILIGAALHFATPMCLAVFPPEGTMPVSQLERRFQGQRTSSGSEITTALFNKGL